MTKVVLEELALMILHGDDSYEVFTHAADPNGLYAEVHLPQSAPITVAELLPGEALVGNCISLESPDFAAADTKLRRTLLKYELTITTTQYWYSVGDPGIAENLYVEDCDPDTHTVIHVGNHTRSFSPTRANSTDFVDALLASGLCESCCWNGSYIEVVLPESLMTDENRSETLKTLLSLYRPGN